MMDPALTVAGWKYGWAGDTEEERGFRIFSANIPSRSPIVVRYCYTTHEQAQSQDPLSE